MATLILRRAKASQGSADWSYDDYDVFEGDKEVGRIRRVRGKGEWYWYLTVGRTGERICGLVTSFEAAKNSFREGYEAWKKSNRPPPVKVTSG